MKVTSAELVYVVGEVKKPGGFPLKNNQSISLLQAIALAEGLTHTAATSQARIVRTDRRTGKRVEIPINLGKLLANKAPDPGLQPKDILFIPNSSAKSAFTAAPNPRFPWPPAWPSINGDAMNRTDADSYQIELFRARQGQTHRRASLRAGRMAAMEKPPDLVAFWRVIRKRRWTVLLAFGVLVGVVLVGTFLQKPVYRAKVLIEIDKEDPGLVLPQEIFQLDEVSDAYLETQYKVLNSDDLAERVIAQLGLGRISAEFRPAPHGN